MSLLDNGPDVVDFWSEIDAQDGDGNPIRTPGPRSKPVRGWFRTSGGGAKPGDPNGYRFLCRALPAGSYSGITWRGRDFDIIGEPQRSHPTRSVAHVTLVLRPRTIEAR